VEEGERAFVRYDAAPGEQSQLDWAHFGSWLGHRLHLFALTLCYSRIQYLEFTQRQDLETQLTYLVHAFRYLGGVTQVILTDLVPPEHNRSLLLTEGHLNRRRLGALLGRIALLSVSRK
jgi:transposase